MSRGALPAVRDIELVVAHYQEDLRWLRRVPSSVRVRVYHKGGEPCGGSHPLPNVGREAHTYLHHLVSRYDELAEVTVFCQGKPFDHAPDFHHRLRALASGEAVEAFRWFGFLIDWDDAEGSRLFRNWSKNPEGRGLEMEAFWRAVWGGGESVPPSFVFYPGAQFALSRDCARGRSRGFYEGALAASLAVADAAHCFERCWDRVFGVEGVPAALRAEELPVYFKPIRRLARP